MSPIIALGPELGLREALRIFGILHLEPLLVERGLDMESLAMVFTEVTITIRSRVVVFVRLFHVAKMRDHRFAFIVLT